jgi:single-strand DNA-binding protein
MNKVILMGRLTKDVEVRYTQTNNNAVASFTLAVDRKISKETDFINIVAWNKTAEFVNKYFKKGQKVVVVGRLQVRNYENEKGKHFITEVIAEETYFADSKKETIGDTPNFTPSFDYTPSADDDLPF